MSIFGPCGFPPLCAISRFIFTTSRHRVYQTLRNRLLLTGSTKPYIGLSATKQFKVRLIETEEEFESIIINALVKEGWRPCLQDAECFMACDPTAAFVGELNGKPIGCLTMAKYGDSFAFGGCYIVNKEYRGKGYGRKLRKAIFARVRPPRSIGIISGLPQAEEMNKRGDFTVSFMVHCLSLTFQPP